VKLVCIYLILFDVASPFHVTNTLSMSICCLVSCQTLVNFSCLQCTDHAWPASLLTDYWFHQSAPIMGILSNSEKLRLQHHDCCSWSAECRFSYLFAYLLFLNINCHVSTRQATLPSCWSWRNIRSLSKILHHWVPPFSYSFCACYVVCFCACNTNLKGIAASHRAMWLVSKVCLLFF